MGGKQSMVGLKMMEAIYPSKSPTVFTDPKLKTILDKEVLKLHLKLDDLEPDEIAVDGDLDADIDRCITMVFQVYDRKKTGSIRKKDAEEFFKDCLELYALRQGKKSSKEILPKNVKMDKALADCVKKMSPSTAPVVTKEEFEKFLNCYDIEEALEPFFSTNGIDIDGNVSYVDTSVFSSAQREGPKLVYRDYPDD
eukprot:TRINITY_DN1072_c0_g1_i1.p1 TRINITY_DN1072_c0_g1~~TRINITY_DN1072_c0_g1_i1.p1  ORF type:complete len:196 (+),score=14.92 TRINITY_DN1072_c0_g1_i1:94-681(+)